MAPFCALSGAVMNTQLLLQPRSKDIHWEASVVKVGEGVLGQGEGDVVLGTKVDSRGA